VIAKRLGIALGMCASLACGGTLDAGHDEPHGLLPVDERNPVILVNDGWSDNWFGEYAMLLANAGGPKLASIIVAASNYWPDLNANATGWMQLVSAARASGLEDIPDVTVSAGAPLTRPGDGAIDSTVPNRSAGAQRIVDLSRELNLPARKLAVLVGTQLTDVADAYLIDPTIVERVVVVAALGMLKAPNAVMTGPNGDLDPWADWIVAHRFEYVQVSAYYDQTADVTSADLANLPQNALGRFIADKQPKIRNLTFAADQVALLAAGLPHFVTAIARAAPDPSAVFGSPAGQGSPLVPDDNGKAYFVTQIAAPLAPSRFWDMLLNPGAPGRNP
jgi:hypothetical protein